jgi:cyanophycinase-like exopeptidase
MQSEIRPGPVALFGSGETSSNGGKVFDMLLRGMPASPRLVLLETPAGFELNSPQVIGRIADFIQRRLQNYRPQLTVIPARRRGTDLSPDNPQVVAPLLEADLIFMGPGSPSYAVRQLRDSLAWHYLVARHCLGATLALASAATVAISDYSLPVYEIYKVGEDLHWKEGLNFFGLYGLPLVFIPHWNNNDGGDELDTSRCYMGKSRFASLMAMLTNDHTVLGIDENTALLLDIQAGVGRVVGLGGVTMLHTGHEHYSPETDMNGSGLAEAAEKIQGHVHQYKKEQSFSLSSCCTFQIPPAGQGLPPEVWERALEAQAHLEQLRRAVPQSRPGSVSVDEAPSEIRKLVAERQEARRRKDWAGADDIRAQIKILGWNIEDTLEGTKLMKEKK